MNTKRRKNIISVIKMEYNPKQQPNEQCCMEFLLLLIWCRKMITFLLLLRIKWVLAKTRIRFILISSTIIVTQGYKKKIHSFGVPFDEKRCLCLPSIYFYIELTFSTYIFTGYNLFSKINLSFPDSQKFTNKW